MVATLSGAARRIVRIGTGKVLATRGRRTAATPAIVRKNAFADNAPNADLRVTKAHSFYSDSIIIPVEFLVNHCSVLWDNRAYKVTIYRIELETHDVIFANGAPDLHLLIDALRLNPGEAAGTTPYPDLGATAEAKAA